MVVVARLSNPWLPVLRRSASAFSQLNPSSGRTRLLRATVPAQAIKRLARTTTGALSALAPTLFLSHSHAVSGIGSLVGNAAPVRVQAAFSFPSA